MNSKLQNAGVVPAFDGFNSEPAPVKKAKKQNASCLTYGSKKDKIEMPDNEQMQKDMFKSFENKCCRAFIILR